MISSKIKSVTSCGIQRTVDIEVDHPSHIFYGNGMATSNSHGISYSFYTYFSAYCKVYYPLEFYKVWLAHAEHKIKPFIEIYYLVNSAKLDGVTIMPPSVKHKQNDFFIKDGRVHFGLRAIKGVGDNEITKLFDIMNECREPIQWNHLLYRLPEINKRSVTALIESGAFDFMRVSRNRMLHEYTRLKELTKTELKHVVGLNNIDSSNGIPLEDMLRKIIPTKKEGGFTSSVTRSAKVQKILTALLNPGRSLQDTPSYIASSEERLMGVALSQSYLDECADAVGADSTCKEILDGKSGKMSISVEIKEVKEHKIKKEGDNFGKSMAFISVKDDTCEFDSVIAFPGEFETYQDLLMEGNTVMMFGEKSEDRDSFIIKKVYQL